MNDGWDDDDDLGLDRLDSMEDDANGKSKVDDEGAEGQGLDQQGWDYNDDDIDINDINDADDKNEDLNHLEYDWGESDHGKSGNGLSMPTDNSKSLSVANPTPATQNESGWEEDEDLFGGDEVDDNRRGFSGVIPTAPSRRNVLQELQDYVESLNRIVSSINAVLEYEYNTPEKAHELLQYYSARPGLAEYTRTKELPRMNYQVVLPNGKVETSKEQIAMHHLPDHSLMARCANQSLLADLIHVLTGPDLVVRPQFLAICVAQTCQFRLHMGDPGRDMVQCNCMLQLSLPVAEGPRLNIATLRCTVIFSPHQPMVKFNVDKIVVMLKDYSKLQPVVEFLNMMEGHFQELPGHEDLALQNAPADIFRDAFLEQTHHLMNQSKEGFKSALQDMESVLGLQSKIKAVRGGLSKFLPDTQAILAVEEEAKALASQRQRHAQPPPPIRSGFSKFLPDTQTILAVDEEARTLASQRDRHLPSPPSSASNVLPNTTNTPLTAEQQEAQTFKHHIPPLSRPPPPPPPQESRPQSILGGLVKTGWSALAKTVLIPDDDPVIYGHAPQPPSMLGTTTNQGDSPTVHLYRRPEPGPPPHSETSKTSPSFPKPMTLPAEASTSVTTTNDESLKVSKTSFDTFGGHDENERENNKVKEQYQSSALDPAINPDLDPLNDDDMNGWGDDDDLDEITSDVVIDAEAPDNNDHSQDPNIAIDTTEEKHVDANPTTMSSLRDEYPGSVFPENTVEPLQQEPVGMENVPAITHPEQASPPVSPSRTTTTTASPVPRKDNVEVEIIHTGGKSSSLQNHVLPFQRPLEVDMAYNPEEDIMPTRQRWVNPRPDRSYLFQ